MMNDDQYLLASAYADGEVTPAERALAETDPAVMAEVERLQALHAALHDVEPNAGAASMIAAAMREFHAAHVTTPEPTPAAARPVVTTRRPSRWFTWERAAGLAAAAVAVVAIGAVVTNGTRGGGDDDSASVAMTEAPQLVTEADEASDATAAGDLATDQEMATIEAPAATAAAADTQAPTMMAEPADGAPAPAVTTSDAGSGRQLPAIESAEQLAATGIDLRAERTQSGEGDDAAGSTIATAAPTECTFAAAVESPLAIPEAEQRRDELLELAGRVEILDQREYRVGPDDVRPALIAVDLDSGQAFAIDARECALLAVGPLP